MKPLLNHPLDNGRFDAWLACCIAVVAPTSTTLQAITFCARQLTG